MKKKVLDNNQNPLFRNIPLNGMWKWQYLESIIRKTMSFFNYTEIRPPLFLSEDTISKVYDIDNDIDSKDSFYRINGDETIYLRPDGTLTYLNQLHDSDNDADLRSVYYLGPMFRKSEKRTEMTGQFHQFGAEAIGIESYVIDVETIRLGLNIFKKFGLSNIRLEINSFGCPECRPDFNKKRQAYWNDNKDKLCSECSKSYSTYLKSSDSCEPCRDFWMNSPSILNEICTVCSSNFNLIKRTLSNLMLDFVVNPHLNMDFPYYNQLVFQYKIFRNGDYTTIGAGGRYDYLIKNLTGKHLPAVGFSANIEILLSLLEERNLLPETKPSFQVYILATNTDLVTSMLQIVQELRDNEIKVILGKTEKNYGKQTAVAQAEKCSLMIILSEDAIREGKVTINDLVKKHSETIYLRDILTTIVRLKKTLTNN